MINQPDTQEQKPQSEKLVLPAPPAEEQQMYYGGQVAQIRPEQLIRSQNQPAPQGVKDRLVFYWRKDPAYKVLIIALTMVLVAGVIFVSLASAAFLGNSSFLASTSGTPQAIPKGSNPTGTVNPRPTFPAPGGGSGTNQQSSQPPMGPTPALQATNSTTQPSPTPGGGGSLNVQFTSIPQRVMNGSYVSVGVNTSEPGATVELVIRYSNQGGRSTTGPQTTDGNGNATIPWFVFTFGQKNVQAYVYALATDQNGQRARSQTVTVEVQTRG